MTRCIRTCLSWRPWASRAASLTMLIEVSASIWRPASGLSFRARAVWSLESGARRRSVRS
eukprot:4023535-Pyramimonas_sp.AAC.1